MTEDSTADDSKSGLCQYNYTYWQCPYALPCGQKPCEIGDRKCPGRNGGYYITWYDPTYGQFDDTGCNITICTNVDGV